MINNLMVFSANNLIVLCFLRGREDRYGVCGGRGRKEECARLPWRTREQHLSRDFKGTSGKFCRKRMGQKQEERIKQFKAFYR
jgi:hypothetical protein